MKKSGIEVLGELLIKLFRWINKKIIQPLFKGSKKEEEKFPYKKKDYFFTIAEKEFLSVLESISKNLGLCVFGKVRMEDLFWLPKMTSSEWMHYRGKVRSRHIDFVLCNKENNYKPIIAIELNDSSHDSKKRKETDRFKEKVFNDANFPFLQAKYSKKYNKEELEEIIVSKIKEENTT